MNRFVNVGISAIHPLNTDSEQTVELGELQKGLEEASSCIDKRSEHSDLQPSDHKDGFIFHMVESWGPGPWTPCRKVLQLGPCGSLWRSGQGGISFFFLARMMQPQINCGGGRGFWLPSSPLWFT